MYRWTNILIDGLSEMYPDDCEALLRFLNEVIHSRPNVLKITQSLVAAAGSCGNTEVLKLLLRHHPDFKIEERTIVSILENCDMIEGVMSKCWNCY